MILTRIKNEDRLELKKELIDFINKQDFFWKMVDHINWKELTNLGRDNYHSYMPTAKDKFLYYIDGRMRFEKLKKLNKSEADIITFDEMVQKYKVEYSSMLKMLENYFFDTVKDSDEKVFLSSDSYWDLRSSIIGYGKEFMLEILEDDKIFIDMVKDRTYCENFGYIFPHKI